MAITNFSLDDKYNKKHLRNARNTSNYIFNCGGYALNTYSWYVPRDDYHKYNSGFYGYDDIDEEMSIEDQEREEQKAILQILSEFFDTRIINNLDELQPDEYAFAFRIGVISNDFHFIKRANNGHWYEKRGMTPIHRVSKKYVFSAIWNNSPECQYCGNIFLFAKKK